MPEPVPGTAPETPVARPLCDVGAVLAADGGAPAGVRWKLAEPGRQLDANLVRLPPGEHIARHAEPDLDVLFHIVAGGGELDTAEGPQRLSPGTLVWLPHGSARSITAGPDGLAYLTVHRRRPGMQIRRRPDGPGTPPPPAAP